MRNLAAVLLVALATPACRAPRVDPVPPGPESIVDALSPFSADPDSTQVAALLRTRAEKSPFPASDFDRVLVSRLWRRAGETDLAMASLDEVAEESALADLAAYEKARVLFEAGDRDIEPLRAYRSACASTDTRVRAEIEWDLLSVTTPEERAAWPAVQPGSETCEWLHRFWEERAHRMIIAPGERIAMHFRRLKQARHEYYLDDPRVEVGMAREHGRPNGLPIDDRGLLYVRMGEPDHQQACPEEVVVFPDTTFVNRLGICWIYARPPYYRIYYLTTKDRFGHTLPDADYLIQESFSQQAEPGTMLFQQYVMNTDLPASTLAGLIRRGPVAHLKRADTLYGAPVQALLPSGLESAENGAYQSAVALAARRYTSAALEQIPDVPDVEITADLRFEALRFLNPSAGRWQVWLLGAVPAGQLAVSDGDDGAATLDVGGRFSVMTPDGMRISRITPLSVPAEVALRSPGTGISLRGATPADPGSLPVSFMIEDLNDPGAGVWIQDTIRVPAVGGLPQLSDIAVAQAEGGTWTRDAINYLRISPVHVTNPDGEIHIYFEVYRVRPGESYEVELRLVPTEIAERIWRLDPVDLAFRLQFTAEMSGEIGRHHLRLDLADTEPDAYTLGVRIQDAGSEAYSLPAVTPIVVAER